MLTRRSSNYSSRRKDEMKIKLSQHTPRITKGSTIITRKESIITRIRKITLEDLAEIYLVSYAIHVMRRDTLPKIVKEIKVLLTRRRKTKEDIMLILHRMMNLSRRESNKKVNILQAMKSMF